MTDRQRFLIEKINDYVECDDDDLYLDFDDYRELNDWLQKSLKLKNLAKELYDIADLLCDNLRDFPAGCDACYLCDEDDGCCDFKKVRAKYKELIG